MTVDVHTLPSGETLTSIGPSLDQGSHPALFYFALTAEQSLSSDPINRPAVTAAKQGIRVFSLDLPYHDQETSEKESMIKWAKAASEGKDFFAPFIESALGALNWIQTNQFATTIGLAGISRGAFAAVQVAAESKTPLPVLGFSPLTSLSSLESFTSLPDPLPASYQIHSKIPQLIGHPVRFYIGNCDTRVGVASCASFITELAATSFKNKIRSPEVELFIIPSIGRHGHGTSPETFDQGTMWMVNKLKNKET